MAFLEEEANITTQNIVSPHLTSPKGRGITRNSPLSLGEGLGVRAADYSARIPTIYGKKL
jgi:hypothetical protein